METWKQIEIGTKENETLKPEKVTIVGLRIDVVGEKKSEKLICIAKHPARELPIEISSAKIEKKKGILDVTGLWLNKDEDEKISKNSALAKFLIFNQCKAIADLDGKSIDTTLDEGGYLVFKAY